MQRITCEDLLSVWAVQQAIEKERRRLVDLRILVTPRSPRLVSRLDGMPSAKAVPVDFERIAGMIVDCQLAIDNLGDLLDQRKFQLMTTLQSLNLHGLQHRVLSYLYVACLKVSEIAGIMNFTCAYVNALHRKGLAALGLTVDDMKRAKKSLLSVA